MILHKKKSLIIVLFSLLIVSALISLQARAQEEAGLGVPLSQTKMELYDYPDFDRETGTLSLMSHHTWHYEGNRTGCRTNGNNVEICQQNWGVYLNQDAWDEYQNNGWTSALNPGQTLNGQTIYHVLMPQFLDTSRSGRILVTNNLDMTPPNHLSGATHTLNNFHNAALETSNHTTFSIDYRLYDFITELNNNVSGTLVINSGYRDGVTDTHGMGAAADIRFTNLTWQQFASAIQNSWDDYSSLGQKISRATGAYMGPTAIHVDVAIDESDIYPDSPYNTHALNYEYGNLFVYSKGSCSTSGIWSGGTASSYANYVDFWQSGASCTGPDFTSDQDFTGSTLTSPQFGHSHDEYQHMHESDIGSTLNWARTIDSGEEVIIEPLRITQESWRINDTQPEWDGEDFYRFLAYDQEGSIVHVEVLVSNVADKALNPNDFIRVEGEWLEPLDENAPILSGHHVEVIEPDKNWNVRPNDL